MSGENKVEMAKYRKFATLIAAGQPISSSLMQDIHKLGCNLYFVLDAFGYIEHVGPKRFTKKNSTPLEKFRNLTKRIMEVNGVRQLRPLQKEAEELLNHK